jgi:hypothetical protein
MTGPSRSVGRRPGTHAGIDWDQQPLGRVTDNALARRLGVNFGTVWQARRRRGIARYRRGAVDRAGLAHLLGQVTDLELARRLGVAEGTVRARRKQSGLPSASAPRIDWDGVPLGQHYDTELAEALGVTVTMVADARTRRRIPPYREQRTCGCGRSYLARSRNVLGCSTLCSQAVANYRLTGRAPEMAVVAVAVAALRRTVRRQINGR